jgi:putative component of toxin-antitoxin plasmid stabilization module
MIEIKKTAVYAQWIDGLRDIRARARILARIERLALGNPGDVKSVGGDKGTQDSDIKTAQSIAKNI